MRVVIKVGTSLIAPAGRIDANLLRGIVDQFDLAHHEYLIVTSGAIAAGMSGLGIGKRPGKVSRMQACAAVGQSRLMHTYERLFFGKKVVAQLLLSNDDFTSAARYRNLQNTLAELLALGVVPIINENDSVSVRELEGAFGDNDELSSLLARAVHADWLLLLTNVDGFLIPNGRRKPRLQRVIRKLTSALEAQCSGKSALGRGGMLSKLRAARLASEAGVHVVIVNGNHPQAIRMGMQRKIGTYFPPRQGT
ncbi:MAG TPA: glutamate 5-kinase [Verrucomicrobiae bacterium]|nr:glutamate 5-kinase [Verrucomicrobiae bacterium]